MPRVRIHFTVRRLMIAVAVAALVMGGVEGWRMKRRGDRYRELSVYYGVLEEMEAATEKVFRQSARTLAKSARGYSKMDSDRRRMNADGRAEGIDPGIFGSASRWTDRTPVRLEMFEMLANQMARSAVQGLDQAEASARKVDYYSRLKKKYEHAARYPWLPVEPDPPEPR